MLRPFPQYSGVTDVYGNVAWSNYDSLQLTLEQRRVDDGLTVNVNYTYSRTEDNLAARTGYDFEQDWAIGVNDQPHVFNLMAVYDLPFGKRASRAAATASCGAIARLADVGHHAVPIGPAARLDRRRLQPAECRHVLRRIQPGFSGPVRINGDYGDGDVLGDEAADLHRPQRVRVARRRSPTATRRARWPTICATRAASTRI